MSVIKYKNIINGQLLYASAPPKTKEIDGSRFIEVSFDREMTANFWMNENAIKLERTE